MKKLNKKTLLNLKKKLSNINMNKFMLNNLNDYSLKHYFKPIELHSKKIKHVPFKLNQSFSNAKNANSDDNNVRLKAKIKQRKNELQR